MQQITPRWQIHALWILQDVYIQRFPIVVEVYTDVLIESVDM